MKNKWIIFWIITTAFLISLFLLNGTTYGSYKEELVSYFEFFKINGIMFAIYGVVISSFWSISNSLENSLVLAMRTEFDRRTNSMKLFEKWDDNLLLEARDFTRELREKRSSISDNDLLKMIKESPDTDKHKNLQRSLVVCFNYFELIYVSIQKDLVDESMLKGSFSFIFKDMYTRFKPWLENEAHCNKDTKDILDKLFKSW